MTGVRAVPGDILTVSISGNRGGPTVLWKTAGSDAPWVDLSKWMSADGFDFAAACPEPFTIDEGWIRAPWESLLDGAIPGFGSWSVSRSDYVHDGQVVQLGHQHAIIVGTGAWSLEECRQQALRTVRHGLADILGQLGEPVGPPPVTGFGTSGREVIRLLELSVDHGAMV